MSDPSKSTEQLRRLDARLMVFAKWGVPIFWAIVGLGITGYCVRHIVEESAHLSAPGIVHTLLVALFGVLGLCIAGGKRTIDGLTAITSGIRAYRSRRSGKTDEHEVKP